MIKKYTEEFKREAVQLALSNNLPRQAIAEDLGVSKTSLNCWIRDYRTNQPPHADSDLPINELQAELSKLKRENKVLRDESDLLKKATAFFASQKYEMVGLAGLEPARPYGQQILSLQRLPFRHRPIS